jgi:hypothetical protein
MSANRLPLSLAAALLAAAPAAAQAQTQSEGPGFELRPFVGAYLPTGAQRDVLEDAVLAGAQASWRILPAFAITGTFGWAPSTDRLTAGTPRLDVYQYDLGAELRAASWRSGATWTFSPFVGLGAGGRTYDYRDGDVDPTSNVAGYATVGGDVGLGPFGLRVEARDYVSRFKPLAGTGDARTRNDVALAAGFSYRF